MKSFRNEYKCSFVSNASPIVVKDDRGRLLFYKINKRRKNVIFNLPEGVVCHSNTTLSQVPKFNWGVTVDDVLKRHKPTNHFPLTMLEIVVKPNPKKCTVYPTKGIVVFDPNYLYGLPPFAVKFIMYHELGHYFYKKESHADLFAAAATLQQGGNMNDCVLSLTRVLSNNKRNRRRARYMVKQLKRIKRNGKR